MRTRTLTVALLSALLIASAGTAGALTIGPLQPQESPTNATTSGDSTAPDGPSVTFDDQSSSGRTVLVQSATVPEQGFVAIYDSSRSGNETDQIIGASYLLQPGTSDNIRIRLDRPLAESKSLTAVVHTDSNGNGEFDYVSSGGEADAPLTPEGDRRIVGIAQVTVENAGGADGSAATATTMATTTDDETAAVTTDGMTTADATDRETTVDETIADDGTATETTAEATAIEETTAGDAAADETTAGDANASGDSGSSGAFGPGFGPLVALVALLAAALLVARRRE